MKMKFVAAGMVAALGVGLAIEAFSQAKPDVLVRQRSSAMVLAGKYFGPLGGMAQGKVPFDAKIVARNAGYLDVLSQMPWDGFDASTQSEKSRALPAIWSEGAKWKQAQDTYRDAVVKLVAASKGTDEGGMKAAIGDVGKACGGCHDNFRQKQ
jgi:cytochrome c556